MNTPEFTTQAFLDWLRQQPKEREFDYWNHAECACASFCKEAMGGKEVLASGLEVECDGYWLMIPKQVVVALESVTFAKLESPLTFTAGQLLEKLIAA